MTDLNTRMPPGNDVVQRTVTKPAFSDDLLEQMLNKANLQQAWKQVRANKGAAGVDGMTIEAFPDWVLASTSHYLEHRLKLTVNTAKSRVVRTNESKFLGFTFKGTQIHWHPDTLRKFKQRIRVLTNRNWGVSMHYQLFKASQYLHGWINYFGIATGYQRCCDLDHWIRRRVRMAYWRQWRKRVGGIPPPKSGT